MAPFLFRPWGPGLWLFAGGCFPSWGPVPGFGVRVLSHHLQLFAAGSPFVLGVGSSVQVFSVPVFLRCWCCGCQTLVVFDVWFVAAKVLVLRLVLPSLSAVSWLGFRWFGTCQELSPFPGRDVEGRCTLFALCAAASCRCGHLSAHGVGGPSVLICGCGCWPGS